MLARAQWWVFGLAHDFGAYAPFVDGREAGLWCFWLTADKVIAVPRPRLRVSDGKLHSTDGPAVSWPNGTAFHFLHGVERARDGTPADSLEAARAFNAVWSGALEAGKVLLRTGRSAQAGELFLQALARAPRLFNSHEARRGGAQAFRDAGLEAAAGAFMQQAIAIDGETQARNPTFNGFWLLAEEARTWGMPGTEERLLRRS